MIMSLHAHDRSTSRNIRTDEIDFVCSHGYHNHNAGVIFCQMRRDSFPSDLPGNHRYYRLQGTTVVLCSCGEYVITVYKNAKAFKKDRKKAKYDRRHERVEGCPHCHSKCAG